MSCNLCRYTQLFKPKAGLKPCSLADLTNAIGPHKRETGYCCLAESMRREPILSAFVWARLGRGFKPAFNVQREWRHWRGGPVQAAGHEERLPEEGAGGQLDCHPATSHPLHSAILLLINDRSFEYAERRQGIRALWNNAVMETLSLAPRTLFKTLSHNRIKDRGDIFRLAYNLDEGRLQNVRSDLNRSYRSDHTKVVS